MGDVPNVWAVFGVSGHVGCGWPNSRHPETGSLLTERQVPIIGACMLVPMGFGFVFAYVFQHLIPLFV